MRPVRPPAHNPAMTSSDESADETAPGLAWSVEELAEPPAGRSWRAAWVAAVAVLLACGVVAVLIGTLSRNDEPNAQAPPVLSSAAVTPMMPPRAVAPTVPATTVTVQATPSTVTVEASPPPETTTVPSAAPLSEAVYDQRFLDRMASLGYVVSDRSLAVSNAHEVCQLLRLGESPAQVNQQMAARTGASMADVLQLTASAMLAYPDC
jgi:hypothetical protein